MAGNPVVWWEINARDGDALMGFYRDVLGWECRRDDGAVVWDVDSTGGREKSISGGIFTGKGQLPPHRCLYVQTEELDSIVSRLQEKGLPILQGPFDLDGVGRLAFFRDPEGHMIGLIERPDPEPVE